MRDMMKGVKNLKDIPAARKMEMCKSYNSMGNMMSHLAKCTSSELKVALMNAKLLCGAKNHGSGSGGSGSRGHEDSMDKAWAKAFGECPALLKFYQANADKNGNLNVKMNPEQAKPLCAEFMSTSSKCRTHAVVGQFLGGLCASSTDICAIALKSMRDMMKGVKNLKDIPTARKMEMCKSYNSMGNMMSHLAKCTSSELKVALMNAKLLCG